MQLQQQLMLLMILVPNPLCLQQPCLLHPHQGSVSYLQLLMLVLESDGKLPQQGMSCLMVQLLLVGGSLCWARPHHCLLCHLAWLAQLLAQLRVGTLSQLHAEVLLTSRLHPAGPL